MHGGVTWFKGTKGQRLSRPVSSYYRDRACNRSRRRNIENFFPEHGQRLGITFLTWVFIGIVLSLNRNKAVCIFSPVWHVGVRQCTAVLTMASSSFMDSEATFTQQATEAGLGDQ